MRPFNEAAGNTPRKTRAGGSVSGFTQLPSMRPRGIPRGKLRSTCGVAAVKISFNEAAGNTPRKTAAISPSSEDAHRSLQ